MLKDIGNFFHYLRSESGGKNIRNRIVVLVLLLIAALFFNRFILSSFASDDLFIHINRAGLVVKTSQSIYDKNVTNFLKTLAKDNNWTVSSNVFNFDFPLFQVLAFLPFSYIGNNLWTKSIFITVNQICICLTIHMLVNLLEWNLKVVEGIIIYLLTCGIFILQINLLSGNLSIIQLTMIVAVFYFHEKHRQILAGIFFGLSLIDPFSMLLATIVLIAVIIERKDFAIILWLVITVGLLSIFTFIFDKNWVIGWLKNLILTPERFPFTNYIYLLTTKYGVLEDKLLIILPIILVSWLFVEIARMPKKSPSENLWLLGISGLLNYFVMLQENIYSSVLFLPSLILIMRVWWERITNLGKYLLFFILSLFSVVLYIIDYYHLGKIISQNLEFVVIVFAIILMVNLYWSRLWIIRPYLIHKIK